MGPEASPASQISCSLAAIATCTLIVSLTFAASSKMGLASLFKRCPACVLKGTLAGIGSFLLQSAISTAADHALETQEDLIWFLHMSSGTLVHCLLGICLGVSLYIIDLRCKSPLLLISLFFIMVGAANLVPLLGISQLTHESMENDGWFFSSPTPAGPWYAVYAALDWSGIKWAAVLSSIPRMVMPRSLLPLAPHALQTMLTGIHQQASL